ncbi:MAG TPA: hypothetical protein VFB94_06995 [Acidimicrobiales bacterium]|nr:hypothetical protein [Acidimicrobiales bacterium]
MRTRLKTRMTIEGLLGLASLALAVLTVVNKEWIEELTGLEPDAGSGALEWGIVIAFGLAAVLLGRMAWRDRQRLRTADA